MVAPLCLVRELSKIILDHSYIERKQNNKTNLLQISSPSNSKTHNEEPSIHLKFFKKYVQVHPIPERLEIEGKNSYCIRIKWFSQARKVMTLTEREGRSCKVQPYVHRNSSEGSIFIKKFNKFMSVLFL